MRFTKFLAAVVVGLSTITSVPGIASAQSDILASEATRIIDVTAGQRMLSQQVVKAICLASAEVNFADNFSELREAHDRFKDMHYGLINGSTDLDIAKIDAPKVLTMLNQVGNINSTIAPIVDNMTQRGRIDQTELISLNDQSSLLTDSLNETILELGTTYADILSAQNLGVALTLDIAARQAMLSQQLVKEICMMHLLGNQAGNIRATMDTFDASLDALINGFPAAGVIAPPTTEIRDKLIEVKNIWATLKPVAEISAAGNVPDRDSLSKFSSAMEAVLRTTSEATVLYTR